MRDTQITIKFQYYTPCIINEKDDKATYFDFQRWIAKTEPMSMEALIRENLGIKARRDICEVLPDRAYWFFRFLRLREHNLPLMVREDSEAEEFSLDEGQYVGEGLHAIYAPKLELFMIQVNRNGLGIGALQNYLTSIWNVSDEKIVLKPIMKNIDLKNFKKGIYRKIELGFANIPENIATRNVTFLKDIFRNFSMARCKSASITLSIGRGKKDKSLDNRNINSLLLDISDNTDVVSRASLKCSDNEFEKSDVINLLNCTENDELSFTYTNRQSISHEFMRDKMYDLFAKRVGEVAAIRGT